MFFHRPSQTTLVTEGIQVLTPVWSCVQVPIVKTQRIQKESLILKLVMPRTAQHCWRIVRGHHHCCSILDTWGLSTVPGCTESLSFCPPSRVERNGSSLEAIMVILMQKASAKKTGGNQRKRLRARDACEGFVRGIRAKDSCEWIFRTKKKLERFWPQKTALIRRWAVHFVGGFFLQNGCAQPTLNMIFWRWVHPFCSDRFFFNMEATDFVEKRSSYLEKAPHSIEKKRFVVQNGAAQPLMKFQLGWRTCDFAVAPIIRTVLLMIRK